ncbi:MAG: ribosome maturation factor RimP [Clostridia bacterium]|nr:ribosome maturation factor RimP [Clostridia bacterium]
MGKKQSMGGKNASVQTVESIAQRVAEQMALELYEVTLQKESRGKCLCIYLDKEGGLTLDDCELYHKTVQPLLDAVDYDFLEVSSPGIDRPIKTKRDFERNRGALVQLRLFAPLDGVKQFEGTLQDMDEEQVVLASVQGEKRFPRKSVALIKPIIDFDEDDI